MNKPAQWNATEQLAWTEHEGPGRPPAGLPRRILIGLSVTMGVALGAIIGGDSLCPEHRLWIRLVGVIGIAATGAAVVSALRGGAASIRLSLAASVSGMFIGAIDAEHAHTRGLFVFAGFFVAFLLTLVGSRRERAGARWADRVEAGLRPEPSSPLANEVSPLTADLSHVGEASAIDSALTDIAKR